MFISPSFFDNFLQKIRFFTLSIFIVFSCLFFSGFARADFSAQPGSVGGTDLSESVFSEFKSTVYVFFSDSAENLHTKKDTVILKRQAVLEISWKLDKEQKQVKNGKKKRYILELHNTGSISAHYLLKSQWSFNRDFSGSAPVSSLSIFHDEDQNGRVNNGEMPVHSVQHLSVGAKRQYIVQTEPSGDALIDQNITLQGIIKLMASAHLEDLVHYQNEDDVTARMYEQDIAFYLHITPTVTGEKAPSKRTAGTQADAGSDVDLYYIPITGLSDGSTEDINAYNSMHPAQIIPFSSSQASKTVSIQVRNHTDTRKDLLFAAILPKSALLKDWHIQIKQGEEIKFDSHHLDTQTSLFLPAGAFRTLDLVLTPPHTQTGQAWPLQPFSGETLIDTNDNSIVEQPLIVHIQNMDDDAVLDQLLLHLEQDSVIQNVEIDLENSDIFLLPGTQTSFTYVIQNSGNTFLSLKPIPLYHENFQDDDLVLLNALGAKQVFTETIEKLAPGDIFHLGRTVQLSNTQELNGIKQTVKLLLAPTLSMSAQDINFQIEHFYTLVQPKMNISQTLYRVDCAQFNRDAGIALDNNDFALPGTCLRVSILAENISSHDLSIHKIDMQYNLPKQLKTFSDRVFFDGNVENSFIFNRDEEKISFSVPLQDSFKKGDSVEASLFLQMREDTE